MLNRFISMLNISSSCYYCTLITKCNCCTSVQTVLSQCWCESLKNASFDDPICSHFTVIFAEICKELLLQKPNKARNLHYCKEFRSQTKKNFNQVFWNPTSRQTNIYIYTCLCGSSTKIHKTMHIHTFWKSTDARQSLGCMNCKICLQMNIWNI